VNAKAIVANLYYQSAAFFELHKMQRSKCYLRLLKKSIWHPYYCTRRKLNSHYKNKDLLGMKWQRTATGFLHTFAIQVQSAIFIISELCELYMHGWHAILVARPLFLQGPHKTTDDQIGQTGTKLWTINFSEVCKGFVWFSCLFSWSLYSWRVLVPL